jgi:uncharacterized caspase-like protein
MKKRTSTLLFLLTSFIALNQTKSEYKTITINKTESIVEKPLPPLLFASDIQFIDANQNNRIDANELCNIQFKISNKGKGTARNVTANLVNTTSSLKGLSFNPLLKIGSIAPNTFQTYSIKISSSLELTNGTANFQIAFNEEMGLAPDPIAMNIQTKSFDNPIIEVADYSFLSDNGNINLGEPLQLKILLQNKGQGIGENIKLTFSYPDLVVANGEEQFTVGTLQPGESKEYIFDFIVTKKYTSPNLSINIQLSEKHGRFSQNKPVSIGINAKSAVGTTTINIASNQKDKVVEIKSASLTADIDKNIPETGVKNPNKYALIIGNEDYSSKQSGLGSESNVAFAVNDAKVFKEYALKTFGIEEANVYYLTNATSGEMNQKISLVCQIIQKLNGKGELVFYYAGHGFPDESTKTPYLIPVDVNATNLNNAVNLFGLYKQFSTANPKKVSVFLDACFSGGGRDAGLLAARAVKIKPKMEIIDGNIVVFSATSEEQSALPFKERQHGMFTYHLLKNIQETKGNVTYGELENNVKQKVSIESLKINQKSQDPQVLFSSKIINEWSTWKINE